MGCDKPICECPYQYGEWIVHLEDPSKSSTVQNLAQDKRDYIQGVYNFVQENPAYGTSGKWKLESVSVYRTTKPNPKVFVRFNYKSVSKDEFMAVSVLVKEVADSDSGLTDWMCAIMGKSCAKCFGSTSLVPTTSTSSTTAAPGAPAVPNGKSTIKFVGVDKLRYKGQCKTTALAGVPANLAQPKQKRFNTATHGRAACKAECMTENTDASKIGGQVLHPGGGGSKCQGFAWNPDVAAPAPNCIIYQERAINDLPAGVTTPAPTTPEGKWECFDLKVSTQFESQRDQASTTPSPTPAPPGPTPPAPDAKYFTPAGTLAGGFRARRFKVQALQPSQASYFSPYMWIEIDSDGGESRRLTSVKLDNNFLLPQVMTGGAGYIPVSAANYQKLVSCVPVTGAEMTPAHVVTTDRICIDATTEGYCIQHSITWWIYPLALACMLLCLLLGCLCSRHKDAAQEFEVIVQNRGVARGGPAVSPGTPFKSTFHIG